MEKETYKNAHESNVFFELEEDFSEVHYERIKYLDFSDWIYYISTGLFYFSGFFIFCFQYIQLHFFLNQHSLHTT